MARHESLTPAEDSAIESPSRDTSSRCESDTLLRSFGFEIHARPKCGPNLWWDTVSLPEFPNVCVLFNHLFVYGFFSL